LTRTSPHRFVRSAVREARLHFGALGVHIGIYNSWLPGNLGDGSAVDNAAEDVDQDALHLRVRVQDLERRHHLVFAVWG